ncbi:MAG: tRNA (adenosine(37)-N6)-threonylcarbamoyltransferase complex ATPase subunit type 1 TsaE [Thermoguttaceae bacterium]|jgi:tRNA threonylcarbamoyladenosine biosynthesis protein TsaE
MSIEIIIKNEQETDILGRVLEKAIPNGTVVSLLGTLGAGKTRLVQAIAFAAGVPSDEVSSPTFVLIKEYQGFTRTIYHFDAYRLRDSDEFLQLGVSEYFDSDGISFVEWGDRVEDVLPEDRVDIEIFPLDESTRRLVVTVKGDFDPEFEALILERWKRASRPHPK